MEPILSLVQMLFYIVAITIAILTYLSAKNGLLNSVNTEYYKRVIDKMYDLSQELYEEFDERSNKWWARNDIAKKIADGIDIQATKYKDKLISGELEFSSIGIPSPDEWNEIDSYVERIRSDPFIPDVIRDKAIQYLEGYRDCLFDAFITEGRKYAKELSEGKHWKGVGENHHWLHNRINDHLREGGYGIQERKEEVNKIRKLIQIYFESYNPIKNNPISIRK